MSNVEVHKMKIEIAEDLFSVFEANISAFRNAKSEDEKAINLGRFFETAGQFEQANHVYGLVQDTPLADEASVRSAVTAFKQGNTNSGLKLLEKAEAGNPNLVFKTLSGRDISIQTVKGDVLKTEGDYEGAIQRYRAALKVVESDDHALGGMATSLVKLGRYEEASKIASDLNHPSYRGLRATLELLDTVNPENSIQAIDSSAASVVGVHS